MAPANYNSSAQIRSFMLYYNMASGTLEITNDFETGSNSFCKDCIARVIHLTVKLDI